MSNEFIHINFSSSEIVRCYLQGNFVMYVCMCVYVYAYGYGVMKHAASLSGRFLSTQTVRNF
jgi:hypothetical protein